MIQEFRKKIKACEHDIFWVLCITLTVITASGILLYYKQKPRKTPIQIQRGALTMPRANSGEEQNKNFIASKNGTKYYPARCKAATRIKQENALYFASATDAEKAGYALSSACTK